MRLFVVLSLSLLAVLFAPPGKPPGLQAATILWSADMEEGNLSDWFRRGGGGPVNSGTGVAQASTDVARSGSYSAKMTISGASGSAQAVRLFRWDEPKENPEAYYSAWYYIPQHYSGMSWWNVFQFKSRTASANDPTYTLNIDNRSNGQMYLYLRDWLNKKTVGRSRIDIPVGRWFHLEAYYRQGEGNTGQVTFWQDGVQIIDVSGVATRRPGDEVHWSLANYTDKIRPSTATVYVDDIVISTARVGPGEGAPQAPGQGPAFQLGFRTLADLLRGRAGEPLENEHYGANGDSLQQTTTGLMVWRKSDNWTAFTDGSTTWINGPFGLQRRSNDERFDWERE